MTKTKHRYMLIRYIQTAKYPKRTHEKGYWSNPENTQWDELVEFSLGLKSKDHVNYSVILDLDQHVVVKNSMNEERDYNTLYGYYHEHYEDQIARYLKQTGYAVSAQSAPTV